MRPLGNQVLIRREQAATVTSTGFHIPEQSDVVEKGVVVAVGSGTSEKPMYDLKEGDRVIFDDRRTFDLKEDGEDFVLIHQDLVLAVI